MDNWSKPISCVASVQSRVVGLSLRPFCLFSVHQNLEEIQVKRKIRHEHHLSKVEIRPFRMPKQRFFDTRFESISPKNAQGGVHYAVCSVQSEGIFVSLCLKPLAPATQPRAAL